MPWCSHHGFGPHIISTLHPKHQQLLCGHGFSQDVWFAVLIHLSEFLEASRKEIQFHLGVTYHLGGTTKKSLSPDIF